MSKKKRMELDTLCDSFQSPDDKMFSNIVRLALACGVEKVELAEECAVAPSTIDRWANGSSCPGPNVQAFVVGNVEYLLEKD